MNSLIVIGLCALSVNAQFIPYPYSHNLFNSAAFAPGVIAPTNYVAGSTINFAPQPITYTTAAVAPVVAPVAAPAPTLTKFHAQDEFGQYNFGHFGGPSSRNEVRDAFGVVLGQVNYIDADGKVQQQNYVADANGFRVAATNLPIAPDAPEVAPLKPVEDTPEVTQAKTAHLKAVEDAKRTKRDVGSVAIHSAVAPIGVAPALTYAATGHAVAPPAFVAPRAVAARAFTYAATGHVVAPPASVAPALTYAAAGHAFAPRLTYAATGNVIAPGATYYGASQIAAPRDATLLRVENNPGHAVSYRVY